MNKEAVLEQIREESFRDEMEKSAKKSLAPFLKTLSKQIRKSGGKNTASFAKYLPEKAINIPGTVKSRPGKISLKSAGTMVPSRSDYLHNLKLGM